jgi:hypothetical protein
MGEEGKKLDDGKAPWDLLPINALRAVVDVLGYGARKYSPGSWRFVPDARRRYYAAALRHLTTWWEGEQDDSESKLPHLGHAACCVLFLLSLEMTGEA